MGRMQRQKGKRGELEVVHLFQELGILARRGQRQAQDRSGEPDVVLADAPDLWVEVKRGKVTSPHKAIHQAREAAPKCTAVAVCRNDGGETIVAMRWVDWKELLRAWRPEMFRQQEMFNKEAKDADGKGGSKDGAEGRTEGRGQDDAREGLRPGAAPEEGAPPARSA